jgi:hypothetical protein
VKTGGDEGADEAMNGKNWRANLGARIHLGGRRGP